MANFAPLPSADSRTAEGAAPRQRETIGVLLRRAREEQGGDLDRIAQQLRIRETYLEAIEQARYDRLPGPVYALGFVRTYANHLGLDGEEAVRRFKLEAAGMEQRRDLAFPMPLTPRSIPGGRLVLIACILALCAYGIWHYVSIDRMRPERVAAVPTDLLPPPPPQPATSPPPPAAPPPGAPGATASAPEVSASPAAPIPSAPPEAAPPATNDQTAAASAPSSAAPLTPVTSSPLPPAAPGSLVAPPPPPLPSVAVAQNAPPQVASPPALPDGSAPRAAAFPAQPRAPGTQVATSSPADTPSAPPPRVFGAVDGPSRITLKAVKDCWILVRDSGDPNVVVAQRTLHAGDSYRVPDRAGLVVRTGNASGLEVLVDGKTAPALGGTVKTLTLDPERLLAGSASAE